MMQKFTRSAVVLAATVSLAESGRIGSQSSAIATGQNDHRELQLPDMGDMELPPWAAEMLNGSAIDWSSEGAWNDWFGSLLGGVDGTGVDVCPILEAAVGMGQAFGIAAQCKCNGNLTTTMAISCDVSDCLPGKEKCGDVSMNLTFGLAAGEVATSVCAEFPGMDLKETCFSYGIDMTGGAGSASQTCEASYNGTACDCSIDDFCLKLDCSSVLPGAFMDSCQVLSMVNASDIAMFLPDFVMFDPDFVLDADMIPWETLNWDNLDFDNFNVSAIEWSNSDWASKNWTDLIGMEGAGITSPGVCTFLAKAVEMSEQLGDLGSCACNDTNGLEMSCNFTETCAETDDGLCGTVQMTLDFVSVAAVDNSVCIDYSEDIHPKTCFSYKIPVAGQNDAPGCSASYGDQGNCKCTIDENLCITVDCSEFEPTAITDTCQSVSLGGQVQARSLMLDFKTPQEEAVLTDETNGEDNVNGVPEDSDLSDGGSSAPWAQLSVIAASIAFFSSFVPGW